MPDKPTSTGKIDVVHGLQLLLESATNEAARPILKAAIVEIKTLRAEVEAIRQAVAARLEARRHTQHPKEQHARGTGTREQDQADPETATR